MYPILFESRFITIYSLWFFVTVGFLAGSFLFTRITKRARMKVDLLTDNAFFLFACALIASRAAFIVSHPEYYFLPFEWSRLTELFAIWDKGLSFGAAVAGWLAGAWYLGKKQGAPLGRLLDAMTPAVTLGIFFGSLGAFLDGINYGTPSSAPWAMIFKSANVKYIAPIHPTQLYAAAYSLGITLLSLKLFSLLKGALSGFIFELGLFLFSFGRFLEEFVRGDEALYIGALRVPQLVALSICAASAYFLYLRYHNRSGRDPENILRGFVKKIREKLKLFTVRRTLATDDCRREVPSE